MANIRLSRYQAEECQLPRVCARCGAAASTIATKKFAWNPPWMFLLLLAGLIGIVVLLVLSITLTKRMRVTLPFCQQHVDHWKMRAWVIGGSLALVAVIEAGLLALLSQKQGQIPDHLLAWPCCGVPAVWVIVAIALDLTSIRCQEITDQAIKLSGVHQKFVVAVEAEHQRQLELLWAQPYDPLQPEPLWAQPYDPLQPEPHIRSTEPRPPPTAGGDEFFAPRND